jgi:hypothetical protein
VLGKNVNRDRIAKRTLILQRSEATTRVAIESVPDRCG